MHLTSVQQGLVVECDVLFIYELFYVKIFHNVEQYLVFVAV